MTDKAELLEQLRRQDEVTLLELLDINSSELVDAFLDKLDDRVEFIRGQLEDQEQ